jgi:hypothetical protein
LATGLVVLDEEDLAGDLSALSDDEEEDDEADSAFSLPALDSFFSAEEEALARLSVR